MWLRLKSECCHSRPVGRHGEVLGAHETGGTRALESALRILKAGVLYFTLVFGSGFVLGPMRIVWVVPRVGTRLAELMEMPIMLLVIVVAARWVVQRLALPPTPSKRLGVGLVALGLLLVAEFTLVLRLRGLTLDEYLTNRDPVAGTAYVVMLGACALMPLFVARR